MKTCSVCGIAQPPDAFYKRSASRNGFDSKCKACSKKKSHVDYLRNASKVKFNVSQRHIATTLSLDDYYVKRLIRKGMAEKANIPNSLIEATRAYIQIKRHLLENK